MVGQLRLGYPIADDSSHALGTRFGVFTASGHLGSVDQHSILVIDEQGNVRWKQVSQQMHIPLEDVLTALRAA